MEMTRRSVFLVDDHPLVREWLASLINLQPDLEVRGEAGCRKEAMSLAATVRPEIAIIELSLDGDSGLGLIKELVEAFPGMHVIVFSMHEELHYVERALRAGARGYVTKREPTRNVIRAIRSVLDGKLYLNEQISRGISTKIFKSDRATPSIDQLSNRELEVFELVGRGFTTRRIAEHLNISFKTVQAFNMRIKEKLNINGATELLRAATLWHDSKLPDQNQFSVPSKAEHCGLQPARPVFPISE